MADADRSPAQPCGPGLGPLVLGAGGIGVLLVLPLVIDTVDTHTGARILALVGVVAGAVALFVAATGVRQRRTWAVLGLVALLILAVSLSDRRTRLRVMSEPVGDQQRLLDLLDIFETTLTDFTSVVRGLSEPDWDAPTDLAGWSVHDLVSHTAHLEAVIAGAPEETVPVPEGLSHVTGLMGSYTEQGVIARKKRTRDELLEEIWTSARRRLAETRANPPTDATARPPRTPVDAPWSWSTMLSNRPLDVFMHEQDIRRATVRPGNLDGVGARHVTGVFGNGLGFVLGKRAGAASGQSAAVELTEAPHRFVVGVGEDGRGGPAAHDVVPDTTLRMSAESFLLLSGGRRAPETQQVEIVGDQELGARFLAGLAVTP